MASLGSNLIARQVATVIFGLTAAFELKTFILIWPSMITLVVKGTSPLDGWVYLSRDDVDPVPIAGRRLYSYRMWGREKRLSPLDGSVMHC